MQGMLMLEKNYVHAFQKKKLVLHLDQLLCRIIPCHVQLSNFLNKKKVSSKYLKSWAIFERLSQNS